jgi:hypothetical protein
LGEERINYTGKRDFTMIAALIPDRKGILLVSIGGCDLLNN